VNIDTYNLIHSGRAGFYQHDRGLIAVWGTEAEQFLDGLVTNSVKGLEDGDEMLAAFPDAKGRLIAVVSVRRRGDRFLFETEQATRDKVYQNLFKFTFAGDFFVEDLSEQYAFFEIFGPSSDVYNPNASDVWPDTVVYRVDHGAAYFVPVGRADAFREFLMNDNGCIQIDDELYETVRIEAGIPKFGMDMDETTVVPELGIDGLISYNKGCYIGQEIIARIHFRGHVAKQLTGVVFADGPVGADEPLTLQAEGREAGRITSLTFSPRLDRTIALAYVRYEHLEPGTELTAGGKTAVVTKLPFVKYNEHCADGK
jgi:folate-binding protein YgfZ